MEKYKQFYESNDDFRKFCDKELKRRQYDNPETTIDDILKFKIIRDVGEYYMEKCKG